MIIRTNSIQTTLDKLYNLLSTERKVYYARFGDGDTNIMSGTGRCIEHTASPELQRELITAFSIDDSHYIRGVMVKEPIFDGYGLKTRNNSPDEMVAINFISSVFGNKDEVVFDSHVLLTYIAVCEQEIMIDFLNKFIRPKKKLFIGSVPKDEIEKLVGKIDYYVEVPRERVSEEKVAAGIPVGAYYSIAEWWPKVLECVDDVELVIPTAGMAGRVTCGRLWHLNKNIHCIELGSMVDAVVGKLSRSIWGRNNNIMKIQNLLRDV